MGSSLSTLSARATIVQSQSPDNPHGPEHTLTIDQTGLYPQLLLFGDSITQDATSTLQPRLQTLYVRRADVVNRGYSGYNTVLALKTIPQFLPPTPANCLASRAPVRLVTIFFGANDAALPGNAQHVPLPLYVASLKAIAEYSGFKQYGTRVVIITPAPVDEWQLSKPLNRTAVSAQRYAEAARQLASELNLPCVDLWAAFAKLAGYRPTICSDGLTAAETTAQGTEKEQCRQPLSGEKETPSDLSFEHLPGSILAPQNEVLASLLRDGLHFTPRGYDVLYDELMTLIQDQIPECMPEHMQPVFQSWRDILGVPKQEDTYMVAKRDSAPCNRDMDVGERDDAGFNTDNNVYIDMHLAAGGVGISEVRRNANVLISSETRAQSTAQWDACVDCVRA